MSIELTYRYDGLSNFFAFLAVVVAGSVLLSPGAVGRLRRQELVLMLTALLVFGHYLAIVDIVALYVAWEFLGWIAWLLLRPVLQQGENGPLIVAHITGYGLLAAAVTLVSVDGASQPAGVAPSGLLAVPLLPLLLVPAAARAGQFPFHSWLVSSARAAPPVSALLLTGVFANAGPYLLARSIQVVGGAWPAIDRTIAVDYTLAAILISSLLAWRAQQANRALIYAVGADLGLVLLGLIISTPASLGAVLLLLANNSLTLAALLLGGSPAKDAGGGRQAARARRLVRAIAAASLIGAPPLLGFTARWQLLAVLWGAGLLGPAVVLVIATLPRSLALLRAITAPGCAVTGPASDGTADAPRAGSLSAVIVPGALVMVFSLLPWLPQRYLVGPAVATITGADATALAMPITEAGLPAATTAGALLVAVLALAIFYDQGTGQALVPGGEMLRLSVPLRTTLCVAGSVCRLLAMALLDLAERTTAEGWRMARTLAVGASRQSEALAPRFEDQYYVAAVLLLAIAVSLALIS